MEELCYNRSILSKGCGRNGPSPIPRIESEIPWGSQVDIL